MPREKDPFWKYATFLDENNSKWRCNFCGQENSGGATRIKAHLAGIGGFGIKRCERVDADVRAEARDNALMARRVMDLSDRGVSEERIQGNVRAASTGTSHPPNVEEGTNSQFPQGMHVNVRAEPRDDELMARRVMDSSDRGVSEERIQGNVRAALTSTSHPPNVEEGTNLQFPQGVPPSTLQSHELIDGATSHSSASHPPNDLLTHDQLTSIIESLDLETTNAHHIYNQLIFGRLYSPPQIPEDINYTMGSSTSEGMPKSAPAGASSSQYDRTTVPQSNEPLPSCNEKCGTKTSSFPLRESMDIYPMSTTHVDLQVLEGGANMAGPSSSQGFNQQDVIELNSDQQSQAECQFHQSSTMPSLMQNSHGESISCSTMALVEGIPYLLDSPFQPQSSILSPYPEEMQMNDQQTPARASSSQYDQLLDIGNSNCLQDSNQHSQLQTPMDIDPSIASQHANDSHIFEATIVDSQVLEATTNTMGLSSSQALVPPPYHSVPCQSINHETRNAQHNSTRPSSSCIIHSITCLPTTSLDMNPYILSSSQAPNNTPLLPQSPPCEISLIDPSSLPELHVNKSEQMMSYPYKGNNFEENGPLKRKFKQLYSREYDIKNELKYGASLSLKKQRMEVVNWLADVKKLRNDFLCTEATSEDHLPPRQQVDILMREAEDLMRHGNFLNGLFEARETKVNKLLERKMVGEAFQRDTTKILEYLEGNQVSRLGIYGMGGVGKTTIMVHVHNRLLEKANYHNVLWITVSQDFNAQKLQDDIWEALSVGTLQEKDVRKRAAMLSDCLTKRGKSIIFLDDVWEYFDLEEVGIPIRADGIKLVLTTRSSNVCCQMHCQEKIKIEPLSRKEAESLFMEELGSEVTFNLETEAVVKSIVKECAGLPLGVITMARSMRGVTDVFEWKDFLVKLKESSMGQTDMEKKVLMNLKFSYDRLGNHEVQQCFLSCALYPEDELINTLELIEFFIDQGLIDGLNTREKQYDRGFTILNKLQNVCLLENHGSEMKMHDLIRDMALHIMSATSIVKAGKGLMRIPPEEYWMDALEKVSLMKNDIREFPLNMSPNCPRLSTFLLNRNLLYDVIPDSFFKKLRELKYLNLSGCKLRELPNSISDLINLRALLLRECVKLRRIPYLGKLISLRKLDICGCVCLEALEGLEKLVNLRYLDLTDTRIERLSKGTLGDLLNLQYLKVEVVNGEDITNLWALEKLQCYFEDVDSFNKLVRVIRQSNPRYYKLHVDQEKSMFYVEVSDDARFGNCGRSVDIRKWSHAIVSVGGESSGICILIPEDVQTLRARKCDGATNLFGVGPLENLEEIKIEEWDNLRMLCGEQDEEVIDIHDSPAPTPTPLLFPSLMEMQISGCPKLKYLFGHGSKFYLPHLRKIEVYDCEEMVGITATVTSPPPHLPPAFPSLEVIYVWCCDKMKRVVESEWLPHFSNLRKIRVCLCKNMEEIVGGPPPYMPVEEISLESLVVEGCDNMRRLFPHELLIHLQNLGMIKVRSCKGMAEIISGAGQGQEGSITTTANNTPSSFQSSISLPKLKRLRLRDLPQLKSIYEVPISCSSMEIIEVFACPKLNRIPLQLRLRDIERLARIEVEGEAKWNTLMWDDPNAQAILHPYLRLDGNTYFLQGY